jgi:hypothetical protein
MNQSDTWQYSTRVNPRVTSADGHHIGVSRIVTWEVKEPNASRMSISRYESRSFMDRDLES